MLRLNLILIFLILTYSFSFSQLGSNCANAHIVNSIPFNQTGMTTAGSGNDYDNTSACGSVYMSGEDYIFSFTPTTNLDISVVLTNTGVGVGLFITDKCPDDPTANCIAINEAQNGNPEVNGISLLQDSTYFIIVSTYNLFNLNPNTAFNIEIRESFPIDIGINTLYYPRSGCEIFQDVNIFLKNFGTDTVSNFDVAYIIDGGTPVVKTCTFVIPPGVEQNFSFFGQEPDLSIVGYTYDLTVYTMLAGDGNLFNDTVHRLITHSTSLNTFPYYEDFESGNGGWAAGWRNPSESEASWELGVPNAPIIDTAHSGINAWVTNLDTTTNVTEHSYVIGPCFDFSGLSQPIIDLWIWYETQTNDYVKIDYSLDSSFTWTPLGSITTGVNWYNTPSGYGYEGWHESSGGWVHAIHNCYMLGGQPQVQFRITFDGGINGTAEGFAFDDIRIYEAPVNDLSAINVISPMDGCSLSNNETVIIEFTNLGLSQQSNFSLSYSVDGGNTFVNETFLDTIYPQDTIVFPFTTNADFSNIGLYDIVVATSLLNDDNQINDTTTKSIFHFNTINSYPYIEDFETNDGGWFSNGSLSSWEHGTPSDVVIDHAASGTNAWVTNLSGVSNLGEKSFLYTPCFDFSDLLKPHISMNIWYDIEPIGTMLEYSLDDGQTWTNTANTQPNWYNQGYNWIHSSNDWVNVDTNLFNLAGEPQVHFRFNFTGANLYSGFGVDDFTICEEPRASFTFAQNAYLFTFTDESMYADTYYWDFGDTTYSSLQNPVHTYDTAGTYNVMLVANGLCGTDTSYQIISFVGIDEINTDIFSVYPNPAKEEIFVRFENIQNNELIIELVNLQGQTILNNAFEKTQTVRLPLNNIAKGMYFLNIKTEKGNYSKKITVN